MNIFTIHFATINTIQKVLAGIHTQEFTIHFATINTKKNNTWKSCKTQFTIHFATINTRKLGFKIKSFNDLQYTLLLLIPTGADINNAQMRFTIHFATINTS